MKARIYKPSKSTMQSGMARTSKWVLEYESDTARTPEPLMGWTSCGDTCAQVSMEFDTLEDAQDFAKQQGVEFSLATVQERKVKPRNYGDNFKYTPPADQKK